MEAKSSKENLVVAVKSAYNHGSTVSPCTSAVALSFLLFFSMWGFLTCKFSQDNLFSLKRIIPGRFKMQVALNEMCYSFRDHADTWLVRVWQQYAR